MAQIPEKLGGRYRHVKELSKTIYGSVYLALNEESGDKVAVKISSIKEMESRRSREDPMQEKQVLETLNQSFSIGSQYIVRLLDSGESKEWKYSIMEYAEQGELLSLILNHGRLKMITAQKFFTQLALGIACIHEANVSHLDLSLENILIMNNDIRITDFGLSRNGRFFKRCPPRGKHMYMAPEVFAAEPFDGFKADVWSAGIMLFIMMTGCPVYKLPSPSDDRFRMLMREEGVQTLLSRYQVPEPAVDLLKHVLCDAKRRYTIDQVIAHPWVDRDGLVDSKSMHVAEEVRSVVNQMIDRVVSGEPKSPMKGVPPDKQNESASQPPE